MLVLVALFACGQQPSGSSTAAADDHPGHAGHTASSAHASGRGETAAWTAEGDTIRGNNTTCAISRAPLAKEKLGAYVATVTYTGADPRFSFKKMVFNQCREMCVDRFPTMWKEDAETIMRYHGLL